MAQYTFERYKEFSQEIPFSFSKHTTIGCGGTSNRAFYPKNTVQLTSLLKKLQEDKIFYCVLGNGSNVLPSDDNSEKVVVSTKHLTATFLTENGAFAYTGVTSAALLRFCKMNRYSGVEFLQGIPCTLGGALFMNAGVSGKYIADVVQNVLVYRDGKIRLLSKAECGYAYKQSVFMNNEDVIIGAALSLTRASEADIEENEKFYALRRAHLPKGKSMGCVFKNPDGAFAGDLIERSGLKGLKIGGAYVSTQHANFIINDGNATSKDIQTLIEMIKNAVFAQYGIRLEEEIRRI